jgi:hypothetical protein
VRDMKVDGVFTDHPDLTRRYIDRRLAPFAMIARE